MALVWMRRRPPDSDLHEYIRSASAHQLLTWSGSLQTRLRRPPNCSSLQFSAFTSIIDPGWSFCSLVESSTLFTLLFAWSGIIKHFKHFTKSQNASHLRAFSSSDLFTVLDSVWSRHFWSFGSSFGLCVVLSATEQVPAAARKKCLPKETLRSSNARRLKSFATYPSYLVNRDHLHSHSHRHSRPGHRPNWYRTPTVDNFQLPNPRKYNINNLQNAPERLSDHDVRSSSSKRLLSCEFSTDHIWLDTSGLCLELQ